MGSGALVLVWSHPTCFGVIRVSFLKIGVTFSYGLGIRQMIYPRTSTENVTSDSPQLSPEGRHNTFLKIGVTFSYGLGIRQMIYPRTSTENVTSGSPQLSPKGRHNTRDAAARVKRGERETKRRDATRGLPRRSPIHPS